MCLFVALGLLTPRLIMVLLWLFSDYLSHAYGTWVVPLLGFFLLPTTTLAYAIAQNSLRGWDSGAGILLILLGFAVDVGLLGGGRGILRRRDRA